MVATVEDVTALRDVTRTWITEHASISRARALGRSSRGGDGEALSGLLELGWGGGMVPEADGGTALGLTAMAALAEECGRELVALPVAHIFVGPALVFAACEDLSERARLLPALASGEERFLLSLDSIAPNVLVEGEQRGGSIALRGELRFVPDVGLVDRIILPVRFNGEIRFLIVSPSEVAAVRRSLVDRRSYTTLFCQGDLFPAASLLSARLSESEFETICSSIYLTASAEALGAVQSAFDMTVEYLKTREQFGKPIGSFQALQHRAAQALCQVATLRAVVEAAAAAGDQNDRRFDHLASLAKALSCETSRLVMAEAIQLHGGIGMTEEHDVGLYFKRGRVTEFLLGDAHAHRARYADFREL